MPTAPAPASAQAPTPTAGGPNGKQAPPSPPFRCGTQDTTNLDGYSNSWVLGTGTSLPNYEPSVNSYLRGCWIQVDMAWNSSNAAAVAYAGDGPFSLLAQVAFLDTQQRPIIQVTGYQLAEIMNKFGGYFAGPSGDPRGDVNYTASTGTGAGSIHFTLWLPLEINMRTGVGSALNKHSSQTYTLSVSPALTVAAVFSTGPTAADITTNPTVTISEDGWWQPQATDVSGAP